MSTKSERRKRQVKFLGEITLWACFIGVLAVITVNIEKFRMNSPYFTVQNIELKIDSQKLEDVAEAFVYLDLKKGTSIFKISPGELVRSIKVRHPEVREVKVEKRLPDTLCVDVKNRIAIAQVHLTQFYPVDCEGFLLPYPSNFRLPELPCIEGIDSSELRIGEKNKNWKLTLGLKIVNLIRNHFSLIYKNIDIDVSDSRNIILYLPQGPKVRLADYKLNEKVAKLKLVLQDIKKKNINPEFIDLRFDKAILIPRRR